VDDIPYHEGPNLANPFADDHARRNTGKVPWLLRLSREEQAQENVDPPEELEWGRKMAQTRSRFLQELVAGGELDKATRTLSGSSSHDAEPPSARRSRTQQYYPSDGNRTTFHHYVPTNGGKVKPAQSVLPAVHASMRTREHWFERRDNYSLLHQVWQRVQKTDSLADSDDEGLDEHARLDYQRRLHVLDLIRPSPTPHSASSG